jgi:hypothetical protein
VVVVEPPSPLLRAPDCWLGGGFESEEQAARSEAPTNPDRAKRTRETLSRFMFDLTRRETQQSESGASVTLVSLSRELPRLTLVLQRTTLARARARRESKSKLESPIGVPMFALRRSVLEFFDSPSQRCAAIAGTLPR